MCVWPVQLIINASFTTFHATHNQHISAYVAVVNKSFPTFQSRISEESDKFLHLEVQHISCQILALLFRESRQLYTKNIIINFFIFNCWHIWLLRGKLCRIKNGFGTSWEVYTQSTASLNYTMFSYNTFGNIAPKFNTALECDLFTKQLHYAEVLYMTRLKSGLRVGLLWMVKST